MKKFGGFPARMQFTPLPNLFFSSLLPQIDDIAELKTTLHVFRLLYAKKGYPRLVAYGELLSDKSLMSSLGGGERSAGEMLGRALEMASQRGTILRLALNIDGSPEDVYFLNSQADRRTVAKIKNGELAPAGLKAGRQAQPERDTGLPLDIFTLYEENVGMLTPMIVDELLEAEKVYREGWIGEAIKEATKHGVHKWSYISAILEQWAKEGKKDGTYRGDSKTSPDKFSEQEYGHIFKR
ncbi:MAG: DnaD domain protein [Dehalococcoidales bacterium]|jgi:DnaD/phage-associated family protein|nr:DnaD domain protein [Dehalococcoidales bacterium]